MESEPAPRRVLLKISGGSFASAQGPFCKSAISFIAREIAGVHGDGVQLAVVSGGGNVIRGASFCPDGPGRLRADDAGMLATLVNVLVLRDALERLAVPCTHYCAFPAGTMAPVYERARAVADLERGNVVLLAGGTGNPLFTTDSAAALRAAELDACIVLKATRVDGVYSADPEKDPGATRFERLTYQEVLERRLRVMDWTAVSFCMERGLPLLVFDYTVEGSIRRAAAGQTIGTLIGSAPDAG